MNDYKTGDEAFYHEGRELMRVAVVDRKPMQKDNTPGEEFKLKVLEVIVAGPIRSEVGSEFEVWQGHREAPQAFSWYLSNR